MSGCARSARSTVSLIRGGFVWKRNAARHHDAIFSCRQLAQMSLPKSLIGPAHKGVCEPISPCPTDSGSFPLPCPLKNSNVFFTQLCAGLCVQACVVFPLTRAQSQQQHTGTHTCARTHTHTFFRPSGLGPICSCCCCCCCCFVVDWLHPLKRHRYAAPYVRTLFLSL